MDDARRSVSSTNFIHRRLWNRPCASRSEIREGLDSYERLDFTVLETHNWPGLDSYFKLVTAFNRHKLTHEADILDAFAGITSVWGFHFAIGRESELVSYQQISVNKVFQYHHFGL